MNIPGEIRELLEAKASLYNNPQFIESDPISIPHMFTRKEDIEISGLLTATISWGQRKTIIQNARKMVELMDLEPYDFIIHAGQAEKECLAGFCHRTFNGIDFRYFIDSLKNIYNNNGGLEAAFGGNRDTDTYHRILLFRKIFFQVAGPARSRKHLADPSAGSSAKRINMFLRWMVRQDRRGVDFGIWKSIPPSALLCPLDVHSGRVARKLGLLSRKQNDWKAVEELTFNLRQIDPEDPVKYDYALFGLGVFEKF